MRSYDLSPLYRSTVGFDRLFTMLDQVTGVDNAPTYPPYNIERTGEDAYRISIAVAGFGPSELSIETRESESETVKLQQSIFSALQALEPSRRQLVIAAYIHGESRHRLSELYGVPVNTIKTWIRRALLEVRAQIGAMPSSPSDVDLLSTTVGHQ